MNIIQKSPSAHTDFIGKMPLITASFWFMKVTATTLGETGGDWLSMTMGFGYLLSMLIFFGFFLISVGMQIASKKFRPVLYWSVIVATSTAEHFTHAIGPVEVFRRECLGERYPNAQSRIVLLGDDIFFEHTWNSSWGFSC